MTRFVMIEIGFLNENRREIGRVVLAEENNTRIGRYEWVVRLW